MRISDWISDVCSSDLETTLRCALGWPIRAPPGRRNTRTNQGESSAHDSQHAATGHVLDLSFRRHHDRLRRLEVDQGLRRLHPRRPLARAVGGGAGRRSEEHTSELQSLMRISYAVFCLK